MKRFDSDGPVVKRLREIIDEINDENAELMRENEEPRIQCRAIWRLVREAKELLRR